MAKVKVTRSAISGRFVTKAHGTRSPKTTVRETVNRPSGKGK
jgi:hypothetical protein